MGDRPRRCLRAGIFHWRKIAVGAALLACGMAGAAIAQDRAPFRIAAQLLPDTQGNPYNYVGLPAGLIAQAIYDPLVQVGPGGKAIPALAIAWEQVEPTVWRFTLREKATFATGAPLTADAVAAAVNYLISPAGRTEPFAYVYAGDIAGVRVVSERVVEIILSKPNPIFHLLIRGLRIPEPNSWQDLGRAAFSRKPVGSGPFVVDTWADDKVTLSANPYAFRRASVPKLEVLRVADQTARLQALLSGTADVALDIAVSDGESLEAAGGKSHARTIPTVTHLTFITAEYPILNDVRVRRALNYAVDKKAIIKAFLQDRVPPAAQPIHPDGVGYVADLAPYPYDPVRARKLLDDAGVPRGFKLPAMVVQGAGTSSEWMQLVAMNMRAVGVDMELRTVTFASYLQSLNDGKWQAGVYLGSIYSFDALQAYSTRSCLWHRAHYCDPNVMPLLEDALAATTFDRRVELSRRVMTYEHDHPSVILLWQSVAFDGLARRVADYRVAADSLDFGALSVKDIR